jgi:hypothetical protein
MNFLSNGSQKYRFWMQDKLENSKSYKNDKIVMQEELDEILVEEKINK